MGMAVGMPEVKGLPAAVDLAKNPLIETHEFRQACQLCYVRTGELFTSPVHPAAVSEMLHAPPAASQGPGSWSTSSTRRSINAKRTLCWAESSTRQINRGSSFGPGRRKPSTWGRTTSVKVNLLSQHPETGASVANRRVPNGRCPFRGCCWKRVFVSGPLHVCVLPGGDRRVDSGEKGIHLQGAALRSLRPQLQHQADGPQDLAGASWDIYVSVWGEHLQQRSCQDRVCVRVTFAAVGSWWQHRLLSR